MSTNNKDPLQLLFEGEPASLDTISGLEVTAYELVDRMPAIHYRRFEYVNDITEAVIYFAQYTYEETADSHMDSVEISMSRENGLSKVDFTVSFTHENQLNDMHYSDEEQTSDCVVVANELLEGVSIDRRAREIVLRMRDLSSVMYFDPIKGLRSFKDVFSDIGGHHVADTVRELIKEYAAEPSIGVREFEATIDESVELTIIKHEYPSEDIFDSVMIPELQIIVEDQEVQMTYSYNRNSNGERNLEACPSDRALYDEVINNSVERELVRRFREQMNPNVINADLANLVIDALVRVQIEQDHTDQL